MHDLKIGLKKLIYINSLKQNKFSEIKFLYGSPKKIFFVD